MSDTALPSELATLPPETVLPSIAVIVPAHNCAAFFPQMVATVQAQAYRNLTVVIADDGSTDDIADRVAQDTSGLRIQFLQQPNRGPAAARNLAIESSESELVAFLDMDDLWAPGHLHRLVQALRNQPDAGLAQGRLRNFAVAPSQKPYWLTPDYRFVNLGTLLVRRQVFATCGLFNETMRYAEDIDFIMRCWEQNIPKVAVEVLSLLYRRHESNMTNGKNLVELGLVRVFKNRLDRLRRTNGKDRRMLAAEAGEPCVGAFQEYQGTPPGLDCEEISPMDPWLWSAAMNEPTGPKVSVVMPHHDGGAYTVASLQSIFAQAHRPLELIFVDDGSASKQGVEIASQFGEEVRILERPASGPAASRNAGCLVATGKYLGFLDQDDLWATDKLTVQVAHLEANPDVDAVFCHVLNFRSPDLTAAEKAEVYCSAKTYPGGKQCAMLIRSDAFKRVGLLDENLVAGDFADWYDRAVAAGLRLEVLPQVQLFRRLHRRNFGRVSRTTEHKNYLQAVKKILDRRRTAADQYSEPSAQRGEPQAKDI